jgi:hypothetical protein
MHVTNVHFDDVHCWFGKFWKPVLVILIFYPSFLQRFEVRAVGFTRIRSALAPPLVGHCSTSCGPLFHLLWAIIPVKLSTLGFTLHVTPLVDHPPIFTCDLWLGLNCLIWLPISYVFSSAFGDVVKNKLGKYLIKNRVIWKVTLPLGPSLTL